MGNKAKLRREVKESEARLKQEARATNHYAELMKRWQGTAQQLARDLRTVTGALATERRRTHHIEHLLAAARISARQNPLYKTRMRRLHRSVGSRAIQAAMRRDDVGPLAAEVVLRPIEPVEEMRNDVPQVVPATAMPEATRQTLGEIQKIMAKHQGKVRLQAITPEAQG